MSENVTNLTAETFDEVVTAADGPVLVDFWAEWCGPCKTIAPIIDEIASEQDGLTVTKLDVDSAGDIAQRYQVMSIPTLLIFNNGEVAKRLVGASSKSKLMDELAEFL